MKKKILIFFICVCLILSFPLTCYAKIVEEEYASFTAQDLYNIILNTPGYQNQLSSFYLENDTLFLRYTGRFSIYVLDIPSSDKNSSFRCYIDGDNYEIIYRTVDNKYYRLGSDEAFFENSNLSSVGFHPLSATNSFVAIRLIKLVVIPDPVPQGDYTDFGTFVMPLISSCISDTWNVFTDCWWALAFLLIPVVFFIFCYLSKIFSFSFVNIKSKITDNIKNNIHSDYKVKYKYGFWKIKLPKKQKKNDLSFVMIDGQRFIPSSIKKKELNKPSSKAEKNGVNPFSGEKYSSADVEKEE